MLKKEYRIIGVMSGTSLDGIDLVYAMFNFGKEVTYKILCTETITYSKFWENQLRYLVNLDKTELDDIDRSYTLYISEVIKTFIKKHDISSIDAVCSHGHTALHRPEEGLTVQIGNRPELSQLLGLNVVCDFRVQDVELGGQGAPLVPVGDRLLFSKYDYCINLGGFANVSFENKSNNRIAFDICPVNIVLNHFAKQLGLAYDDKGHIAQRGSVDQKLLEALDNLNYYKQPPPKSLGLEWVHHEIFPLLNRSEHDVADIISTFTEHIATQISAVIPKGSKVLFTGGGTFNHYLLQRILSKKPMELIVPETELVEFKEALIFGLLGVLKLRGEINSLASVTGAEKNHSSGKIFGV